MLLTAVLTFVHIILCVFLILVVLLQTGKRADLAGAFGGGGSQTAFGTRGAATILSKATTTIAVLFMLTSLGLAIQSATQGDSTETALDAVPVVETAPAPADTEDGSELGVPGKIEEGNDPSNPGNGGEPKSTP